MSKSTKNALTRYGDYRYDMLMCMLERETMEVVVAPTLNSFKTCKPSEITAIISVPTQFLTGQIPFQISV